MDLILAAFLVLVQGDLRLSPTFKVSLLVPKGLFASFTDRNSVWYFNFAKKSI